ncbi:HAD-IIA family hydrolase [Sphingomonas ginkgonis]|uniref:HAD-IIA family hydrolase n=1 Tax=Sphingomonas ginkgonis TaxID=2315330 RepID=A0A429VAL4_9SPHN|nr:HAD-IIA family hydrolase [Sphingomonas ginkgonis]RST30974.1 HAD-IIA family hydrolase [Sphingomonas ginkgonis]
MSGFLDALPARYSTVFCDIWGVVHDGGRLYPGACERLLGWKREGRSILLLTNAPRSEAAVERALDRIGLPRSAYDGVASSGEAGIAALQGRPVGFLGTAADRADYVGRGLEIVDEGYSELACAGLDERRNRPEQYGPDLERWAAAGVLMHCLNPDRIVMREGAEEACAGALADIYETLGGTVRWYGKPHAPIYDYALERAGRPPRENVLAIGDGLVTDVLGAARAGIDCVFVTGGIHGGRDFPADFATVHRLGHWQPVAVVAGLG